MARASLIHSVCVCTRGKLYNNKHEQEFGYSPRAAFYTREETFNLHSRSRGLGNTDTQQLGRYYQVKINCMQWPGESLSVDWTKVSAALTLFPSLKRPSSIIVASNAFYMARARSNNQTIQKAASLCIEYQKVTEKVPFLMVSWSMWNS